MKIQTIKVEEEKTIELMQKIIDIEKKYLYDKSLKDAFDLDRVKTIMEYIDKEVNYNVD